MADRKDTQNFYKKVLGIFICVKWGVREGFEQKNGKKWENTAIISLKTIKSVNDLLNHAGSVDFTSIFPVYYNRVKMIII